MYLLYTDASGTPEPQDQSREYAIVGVALPASAWAEFDLKVVAIKKEYGLVQTRAELHAKDFCVSFPEQDEIADFQNLGWNDRRSALQEVRAKKLANKMSDEKRARRVRTYRATLPFVHLTRAERSALFEKVLDVVGGYESLVLFGEVVRKADAKDDIVGQAFTQLVSRFDTFLERRNMAGRRWLVAALERFPRLKQLSGLSSAHVHKGLLVMDEEPARESSYRAMLEKFRDSGHPWGNLKHVIEAPFFVDSTLSAAVQVADLCAYAVRRYIEFGPAKGSHEEKNFKRIFARFDRGTRLHGLRHYCAKGSCKCLVCAERGHG